MEDGDRSNYRENYNSEENAIHNLDEIPMFIPSGMTTVLQARDDRSTLLPRNFQKSRVTFTFHIHIHYVAEEDLPDFAEQAVVEEEQKSNNEDGTE